MMYENEIEDKLRLAKRLGVSHGWLYTMDGDSPGIAETLDEVGKGRIVLGEIGKNSIQEMAARLAQVRHQ